MRDKFKDFDFKPHPEEVEEREAFERGSPPPLKMPDVVNGKPVKADAAPCADCDMAPMGTYCIECKHYDEGRFEEKPPDGTAENPYPVGDIFPWMKEPLPEKPVRKPEDIARAERVLGRSECKPANAQMDISRIQSRIGDLINELAGISGKMNQIIDRLDRIEKRLDLWMPGQDGDLDAEFDAIRGHGVAVLNGKTECKCLESQDSGWQSQGTSDETCGIHPGRVLEAEGTNEA